MTGLKIAGKKSAPSYALAIPTLNPGHIMITANYFEGSAMIGGDPNSTTGLKVKDTLELKYAKEATLYNSLKIDTASYYSLVTSNLTIATLAPIDVNVIGPFIDYVFLQDPHKKRPVIQFADNRVVRGWLSISRLISGRHLTKTELKNQAASALVANMSNNVIDLGATIVGQDLILIGNHTQNYPGIRYRAGGTPALAANIPKPVQLN